MTPRKPLHTVAKITGDKERNAAREMGHSQHEMDAHAARLGELENYRYQYMQQFQTASKQGLGAVRLQAYRAFLARLDEAISQQRKILEASRVAYEEKHNQWLNLRGEVKALDKLIHRRQLQMNTERNRKEQAESDDHACQSAARLRMS
ncbi:flagellar export protein FliJ [Thiolapillus sp.]